MIKWEDYEISVTGITNEIVIGKSKPIKINGKIHPQYREWVDKSGDRTSQAIQAVIQHLLTVSRNSKMGEYVIEIPGEARLTLTELGTEVSK